jgi:DNA-binding NarL/FixJ family response regulator
MLEWFGAFTLGATSYLLKTARREEIIKAIRGALSGRHIVAPEVAQEIASHAGRDGLTDREIVVLSLVAQGRNNRHIAGALNITEDTVKARMKNIMAKLGAEDRTRAVMIAVKRGFLDSLSSTPIAVLRRQITRRFPLSCWSPGTCATRRASHPSFARRHG